MAEQARAEIWEGRGFLRDLFLGRLSLDLIHPSPITGKDRPEFTRFLDDVRVFPREQADPVAIDARTCASWSEARGGSRGRASTSSAGPPGARCGGSSRICGATTTS